MKKIFSILTMVATLFVVSCSSEYDDTAVWDELGKHNERISKLETLCGQMNTNISSLQAIVTALQNNDYVTGIAPITQNGVEIGYTISFSKSGIITIYHGEDGKDGANGADGKDGTNGTDGKDGVNGADGKDGVTPIIGVKQDTDGIYYWTVNGEWLLDEVGNKVKAVGTDGKDGVNGTNGTDGITPQLKIEDDYWYISYDNGASWTQIGKATGEDGQDGANGADGAAGKDGDSFFQSIDTSNSDYIIFTLADGTEIKLPTWYAFEQLKTLCNQMNTNLESLQTVVAAMQEGDYITSCTPLMENGKQIGYTIVFAKMGSIVIYHGKDGANGSDGADGSDGSDGAVVVPTIGIKQDTNGIYYWTLDGQWLLDSEGYKVRASPTDGVNGEDGKDGANGSDGADGKDGITPQLKIEEGYWYVSYNNGESWESLGKATGEDGANGTDGKDGDSFFQSVTENEDDVVFTLADGTTFTVPKSKPFSITFDTDTIKFSLGCTYTINYTINGADEQTSMQVMTSDGLRASYEHGTLDNGTLSGVITVTTPTTLVERTTIAVLVSDGRSRVLMQALNFVYEGVNDIADGVLIITAGQALAVGCEGGTIEVPLQTNMNYYVEIDDTAASWLSSAASLSRATLRDETLRFSASENNGDERYGFVYLKSVADNSLIQTLCITQHANKSVLAEVITFTDPKFEACALAVCDFDSSGTITKAEASEIVALDVNNESITDLSGLQHFTNLTSLDISSNSKLKSVDLSALTKLETLNCNSCTGLNSLDLTKNVALKVLTSRYSNLSSLDLSKNLALETVNLELAYNLKSLDLSNHPQLQYVSCYGASSLVSLKVTGCPKLQEINCYSTKVTSLDISDNHELKILNCYYTSLNSIDTSNNPKLQTLKLNRTNISTLNISHNPLLSSLDVSSCNYLKDVNLGNNRYITSLTISDYGSDSSTPKRDIKVVGSNLTFFRCDGRTINSVDLSQLPSLTSLEVLNSNGTIDNLDLSRLPKLSSLYIGYCSSIENIDLSNNKELELFHYEGSSNGSAHGLVQEIDFSNNLELQNVKLRGVNITKLDISKNLKVNKLTLGVVPHLQLLNIGENPFIANVICEGYYGEGYARDIKVVAPYLKSLKAYVGSNIDVTECPELKTLKITQTNLSEVDLSKNRMLEDLYIYDYDIYSTNVIKELNLSNNTNLVALDASGADIQSLNISGCTKLESMNISENYLVTLDLSTNISLKKLYCQNNAIEVLDVSNCPALTSLDCSPMSTLETVYVDATQKINYITYNRSNSYIPDATSVVVR